jgi:hypothetical protein
MIGTRSGTLLPSCPHDQPLATFRVAQFFKIQSETAPVRRYSVITMQLRFLRAIAPVEILVGAE